MLILLLSFPKWEIFSVAFGILDDKTQSISGNVSVYTRVRATTAAVQTCACSETVEFSCPSLECSVPTLRRRRRGIATTDPLRTCVVALAPRYEMPQAPQVRHAITAALCGSFVHIRLSSSSSSSSTNIGER